MVQIPKYGRACHYQNAYRPAVYALRREQDVKPQDAWQTDKNDNNIIIVCRLVIDIDLFFTWYISI